MPNALKGSKYIYEHPEARAMDLMDAFKDKSIKAILCAIGGSDTVRLFPFIDYEIIHNNPKIFMGYSDSTISHFMLNKAGLVSFYGVSALCEFGENVKMFDYTKQAIQNILFSNAQNYEIKSSPVWSKDDYGWEKSSINTSKNLINEKHGYEVLQGHGTVIGKIIGGCLETFPMFVGTEIWPSLNEWTDKILLVETSEDKPSPDLITYYLRNLGALGILKVLKGIIIGKPQAEQYYEEYKDVFLQVKNMK